jgi:predicted house-cleaning noncanonical NTP pyrophosphatase (MazG superfamily)
MNRFYKALEAKYQANIEEALAVLELYFNKSVGVGEHPDILEVLDKYLTVLDDNKGKLQTLRELFSTNSTTDQLDK